MRTPSHSAGERESLVSRHQQFNFRSGENIMRRYVIERDIPEVGSLSTDQLNEVRAASNTALMESGPGIQWVQSLLTSDRIYCHYLAENEEIVRDHARRAGLPCNKVSEVQSIVDPLIASRQRA
jgi:hypothetical protein